ncbi:hypothetical protein [Candidatus Foliamicus sp.]
MRVLIEQECAAVAGGHESECEQVVTTILIVGGAIGGGMVSGGPGALTGATIGGLAAQALAHPICKAIEKEGEETEEVGRELQNWFDNKYVSWFQTRGSNGPNQPKIYAPHELVPDGATY